MDGLPVNTSSAPSPLQRLAAYVRSAAPAAGYDLDKRGEKTRLANDAGMSISTLSRILSGTRMPDPQYFVPLAQALRVDALELLAQVSEQSAPHRPQVPVASLPLTPDAVADSWGLDEFGREMVRAMFERLAKPRPVADDQEDLGGAEAQ
jgi:transcriptional regulator with XRE-family HTH domain